MSRRRKPSPPAAVAVAPTPTLERAGAFLASGRGRWVAPAAAALLALALSLWTFDPKLSLSGDNTEFVTLARSLASGEGLTYTHLPEPRTSTKFPFGFPLLLAPVAALFGGASGADAGTPDWMVMKWLVVLTFAAAAAFLYLLVRDMGGEGRAVATTLVAVSGPLTVSYGHQVMSEVPYLMWSMLALWLLGRGLASPGWRDNRWLWAGIAATIAAYYTRSVGIVLIGATVCHLLWLRDWRRALVVGGACFVAMLPWALRNSLAGGGSVYVKQLIMVNPYRPEMGYLDLSGLLGRVLEHLDFYLALDLSMAMWPAFEGSSAALNPASVALLLVAVAVLVVCLRRRQHLLLVTYAVFFTGTVLLWPWSGGRFFVPLLPVLWILIVHTAAAGLVWLRQRGGLPMARIVAVLGLLLVVGVNLRGLGGVARRSAADYPPAWRNYYEAGRWLRTTSPTDAVISCRKAFWMHVVSGRRTMTYAFAEPTALLADLQRQGVDYVIVDQIGYPQTGEFLVPAIYAAQDRFEPAWQRPGPDTYVLRFDAEP